jgi:hypothetical protein
LYNDFFVFSFLSCFMILEFWILLLFEYDNDNLREEGGDRVRTNEENGTETMRALTALRHDTRMNE